MGLRDASTKAFLALLSGANRGDKRSCSTDEKAIQWILKRPQTKMKLPLQLATSRAAA